MKKQKKKRKPKQATRKAEKRAAEKSAPVAVLEELVKEPEETTAPLEAIAIPDPPETLIVAEPEEQVVASEPTEKSTPVALQEELVREPEEQTAIPAVALPEQTEPVIVVKPEEKGVVSEPAEQNSPVTMQEELVKEPEEQAVASETAEQVMPPERQEQPTSLEQAEVIPIAEPVTTPLEIELEIEEVKGSAEVQPQSEKPPSAAVTRAETANPASGAQAPPSAKQEPRPLEVEAPATRKADRRAHPRYAFTAFIEVVDARSGTRMTTRIRDVSLQGCYADTDKPLFLGTATEIRITKGAKSFEARARVVFMQPGKGMGLMFTAVEPNHLPTLEAWIGESRETSWLAANRRRSQRVLMKIPVRVSGQTNGTSFFEDTQTLAVSAHGASLVVARQVRRGDRLALVNLRSKETLECVVAHIGTFPGEPTQVGVEFMMPNPTFWGVSFPPNDWTPRHPDAKSSRRGS
jgi:hypothetical protein